MLKYWVLILFAALGVLSSLWALLGLFFSSGAGGAVVCICRPGLQEELFLRRCKWLRGLGLIKAPVIIVDDGLDDTEGRWLEIYMDGELCGMDQLPEKLILERNRIG